MRFPYQKLLVKDHRGNIHVAYRPLIPVEIAVSEKKILTYGLIDSGADVCLFGADLCRKLGLKMTAGKKQDLRGIGKGCVTFYLHRIFLRIGTDQVVTEVGFSEEVEHIPFAVLGQKGFFENFLVAFNYPKKWIEVLKAP